MAEKINAGENAVAAFQIEGRPIRGRILRMGEAMDTALRGHDYPPVVAALLGEAILVGALMARALKFDGRLLVQAHGTNEGAVSMIVADCSTGGNVRAYARYDEASLERILAENPHPGAQTLLGGGTFAMTIDQGANMDNYQGLAAIEGETLGDCAEHYFAQSEQVPTRIKLAVGQIQTPGSAPEWRGGGVMIQQIAGDKARGDTKESWETSRALFATLSEAEILDPQLSSPDLLYRLFHEDGVRLSEYESVQAHCNCSRERLLTTLNSFPQSERDSMFEDGKIDAKCDFCASEYVFKPEDF
ncbi:MAG: Hsp33 family molecular chaperone [Robiginitomaculum sp.]